MHKYLRWRLGTASMVSPFVLCLAALGLAAATVAAVSSLPTPIHAWSEMANYPPNRHASGSKAVASDRVMQAQHVILVSIDGLRPDAIATLGRGQLPNFYRFRDEGAWSDNARTDFNYTNTLPNHTTMLTARRVTTGAGHNWSSNSDPAANETIHSNKGSYVASVFDVVHDNGLRTGAYVSKSKFVLFDQSYDGTNGHSDTTGVDNGKDKIDEYRFDSSSDDLTAAFISSMDTNPFHFGFLHLRDPDSKGHSSGWMGSAYLEAVKDMDELLGDLFDLVEGSATLDGNTVVILTSDHGGTGTGHNDPATPEHYIIPFYVWGKGVTSGADLYTLNLSSRQNPGAAGRPSYGASPQPIRNGDAANLALSLLGLANVPGSAINTVEKLAVDGTGTQLPTARFTATPNSGYLPLAVTFDASASTDDDGTIASFDWDFGDGNSGSGATVNHTYTAAGRYTTTLLVTDDFGANGTATEIIMVTDPSAVKVAFQDGMAPSSDYNGTRDTKIKSDDPNTIFGSDDELEVDGSPDRSVILKWDLGVVPLGSTVLTAEITLEVFDASPDSYKIYEMKQDWVESEADWQQYRNGMLWQTEGAVGWPDRGLDVLGTVNATSTGSLTIPLDTTARRVIEAWIDNPSTNHGFILQEYSNASNGFDFDSREVANVSNRPKLTLTYIPRIDLAVVDAIEIPHNLVFSSIYPNPFRSATTLRFDLLFPAWVSLEIVDPSGRTVATPIKRPMEAGNHAVQFYAAGLSSGVYLARLSAGSVTVTRTMVIRR